jgi:hypothetical protein
VPKTSNPNWVYGAKEKENTHEYDIAPVIGIDEQTANTLIQFAKIFPIQTYGRIDARIKCTDNELNLNKAQEYLEMKNLYFLEINSMPTVEKELAFEFDYALSIAGKDGNHSMYDCINLYNKSIKKPTSNGFILSCSILALDKCDIR